MAGDGAAARPTIGIRGLLPHQPSYPLPPPALDEHGAEIRAWLSAPDPGR